jgi:trehalose/maltose hydrolase-like predicted phosphorylase
VAGLFVSSETPPPVPELVSVPDWLGMRLLIDGDEISLEGDKTFAYQRTLDFERGVLLSGFEQRMGKGVFVRVHALRFASLSERRTAVQLVSIAVDSRARVSLDLVGGGESDSLEVTRREPGLTVYAVRQRPDKLAVACSTSLTLNGSAVENSGAEQGSIGRSWDASPGRRVSFSRVMTFARAPSDEEAAARAAGRSSASTGDVHHLYNQHVAAWHERWSDSDVVIEGDEESQRALRFAIYHFISAANPEDEHVSVGARALTGDGYKGHVFWDTEIFLLPFYTLTWPEAARAMLMYRFHTLAAARTKAASLGFRGALYAWESADTGEETTPPFALGPQQEIIPILSGAQEHHISADIAYAVWQYWQTTADKAFFLNAGAEILIETSRFWASRAQLEDDGRFHIRGVIGPDEYHDSVDDNAYTNVMAAFNLGCGLKAASILQRRWPDRWRELCASLGLAEDELATWRNVQDRLFTGFDPSTGLFEQFAGFFSLDQVDLKAYADRTAPMDLVLGRERTQRSQVIKQADVVMLLALLRDRYEFAVHEANFRYYEPRTGHGSSLSPSIHALAAARLGNVELAKRLFDETAAIDLDDTMGNAAHGVHIAALGGLWQTAVLGFAGLALEERGLCLEPQLPQHWQTLRFSVQWQGRLVRVEIAGRPLRLHLMLERGRPMEMRVGSLRLRLERSKELSLVQAADGGWEEAAAGGG